MPYMKKGVLIPSQGIDYSQPSLFIPDRKGFPQNMRFYRNEMRSMHGKTKLGSTAITDAVQIMGLGVFEDNAGTKYFRQR